MEMRFSFISNSWERELSATDLMAINGGVVDNNKILQFNGDDSDAVDIDNSGNNIAVNPDIDISIAVGGTGTNSPA